VEEVVAAVEEVVEAGTWMGQRPRQGKKTEERKRHQEICHQPPS
jgi:hypothetical protein